MAVLLTFALLMLAMTGHASCTWCVCKETQDAVLQKTLDYACGAGADCGPIHSNGPCFQPNTVRAHCSYAVNSYFQRKGQAQGSCDFAGTALISTTDPSVSGCTYPATVSAAGTSTTTPTPVTTNPSINTPSTTTPSNTTPTTTTPYTTTPSNGVLGGIGTGVSPIGPGSGTNTDITDDAGFRVANTGLLSFIASFFITMLMWV